MRKNKYINRHSLMTLVEAKTILENLYERESNDDDQPSLDLEVALLDGASNLENVIDHYVKEEEGQ